MLELEVRAGTKEIKAFVLSLIWHAVKPNPLCCLSMRTTPHSLRNQEEASLPRAKPPKEKHTPDSTVHTHELTHNQSYLFLLSGPIIVCFFFLDGWVTFLFLNTDPGSTHTINSPTPRLTHWTPLQSLGTYWQANDKAKPSPTAEKTPRLCRFLPCGIWRKSSFKTLVSANWLQSIEAQKLQP